MDVSQILSMLVSGRDAKALQGFYLGGRVDPAIEHLLESATE